MWYNARMKITVHVSRNLAPIVGSSRVTVEAPAGASVAELLAHLRRTWPGLDDALAGRGERQHLPYSFFVNRKAVPEKEMENRILRDGDRLHILPPVVGGR